MPHTKNTQRHSWGGPSRYVRKTERQCVKCGIVKVTRHEATCWVEFWRGLDQIEGASTPVCEAVRVLEGQTS